MEMADVVTAYNRTIRGLVRSLKVHWELVTISESTLQELVYRRNRLDMMLEVPSLATVVFDEHVRRRALLFRPLLKQDSDQEP